VEPTHEPELTHPVDLCTPTGRELDPRARGWSRTPLTRANLRGRWGRTKRWDYWAVLAGDLAFGLVYADVDYLGLVSVWWGDLSTGASGGRDIAVPLARGVHLPERSGDAPLTWSGRHLDLRISPFGPGTGAAAREGARGTRIKAEWTEADRTAASLDVFVTEPEGHESLSVVIPWSRRTFQFTTKDQALPAVGRFRHGDRQVDFGVRPDRADGGEAWGVLDVGRGRWPYSTTWNWGGGAGHAESGELIGLQFGAKWTEGTGFTENAVTVDGRLHKIGRELRWEYSWDDPMAPWRVTDPGGALDLTLTPRFDKHGRTNAVLLRTEVHQVFGTWSGTVVGEDGVERTLRDAQGFAEESRNRW
jgi:hypothetical protein